MKVLFFANTAWYLYNFRLGFAKYLRERGFDVVMLSPPGNHAAMLQAEGFRWIPVAMERRSINPLRELGVLRRLSAVYATEKPDIVHHFTIKCVVYGSLVALRHGIRNRVNAIAGMGYVFTNRDFLARLLRPLVSRLMRAATGGHHARLIVQNADDLAAFRAARVAAPGNIRLIRSSGVDTQRFRPSNRQPHARTRVLLAARLLWDKGIGEYIATAQALRARGVPVEMLLAGMPDPGNPASVSLEQVQAWDKAGVITHLGHVSDMAALLDTVDIAVLPSYREGVPRSLTEAASAGVPIITTDAPGCREIVEHGVNGLLVPMRQVQPLADSIEFLHANPGERARLGRAGRDKALAEFDQHIIFRQTLAVYGELLAHSADLPHGRPHVPESVGSIDVYPDRRSKPASSSRA